MPGPDDVRFGEQNGVDGRDNTRLRTATVSPIFTSFANSSHKCVILNCVGDDVSQHASSVAEGRFGTMPAQMVDDTALQRIKELVERPD